MEENKNPENAGGEKKLDPQQALNTLNDLYNRYATLEEVREANRTERERIKANNKVDQSRANGLSEPELRRKGIHLQKGFRGHRYSHRQQQHGSAGPDGAKRQHAGCPIAVQSLGRPGASETKLFDQR